MEIGGENEPGNEGPSFFRVPTPVGTPGFVGPNGSGNDADGQEGKAEADDPVAEVVEGGGEGEALGGEEGGGGFEFGEGGGGAAAEGGGAVELQGGGGGALEPIAAAAVGTTGEGDGLASGDNQEGDREHCPHHQGGVTEHHHTDVHHQPVGFEGGDEGFRLLHFRREGEGGEGGDPHGEGGGEDTHEARSRHRFGDEVHGGHTPGEEKEGFV